MYRSTGRDECVKRSNPQIQTFFYSRFSAAVSSLFWIYICYKPTHFSSPCISHKPSFVRAFAKLRKANITLVISVRPSVRTRTRTRTRTTTRLALKDWHEI